MLDSGVYDDYDYVYDDDEPVELHVGSGDESDQKKPTRGKRKTERSLDFKSYPKMGSEANLYSESAGAETTLSRVRDSYNDLRIKEETASHGRSDLGPLSGRFDRACRLSKSYYFGRSAGIGTYWGRPARNSVSASDFKKVSLSGLDLSRIARGDEEEEVEDSFAPSGRVAGIAKRREDFVESLRRLFDSQLSKYGSAAGSLCSVTSSDYSSLSARDESADEINDFRLMEEADGEGEEKAICCQAKGRDEGVCHQEDVVCLPSEGWEGSVEVSTSQRPTSFVEVRDKTLPSEDGDQLGRVDSEVKGLKVDLGRRVELDIEETMPKLNWDFLEEQLERAMMKEKSASSQLREEILRKMAAEAKHDEEEEEEAEDHPSPARSLTSALSSPKVVPFPLCRRPSRRSREVGGNRNQLQVCFVNEMSTDDDNDDCDDRGGGGSDFPPSEYSTVRSGMLRAEECCDVKSLGVMSQTTRASFDSSKSSLHPLPGLQVEPRSLADDGEENFFVRQARLQAEARIALAQVRPMSYMQFLLEKQARKDSCSALQFKLPGVENPSDFRNAGPQRLQGLNNTQLQIVVNHFLSEIMSLNEELVNLLVERDDLYIVQDSMLVDIEDFTRRAEEWEYKKLIGSRSGTTPPPSSLSSSPCCSSPQLPFSNANK